MSSMGVPLINLCSSLIALNFSYIASFVLANHSGTGGSGCGFLAALFHYLFLVGSFAFVVMVTFVLTKWKKWSKTAMIIFYAITFVANWGKINNFIMRTLHRRHNNYGTLIILFLPNIVHNYRAASCRCECICCFRCLKLHQRTNDIVSLDLQYC